MAITLINVLLVDGSIRSEQHDHTTLRHALVRIAENMETGSVVIFEVRFDIVIKLGYENTARHLYDIDGAVRANGFRRKLEIAANTRLAAAKLARDAGYEVRSVNMVG